LTAADRLTPSPDVIYQDLEGEIVLLHLERERYFGLDTIGARAWQGIVAGEALGRIHAALLEEYEVASEDLDRDLHDLVGRLIEAGLVDVLEPTDDGA
jgi:hypothetical protein